MNHENTPPTMLSPILSQSRESGKKNVPAKEPINSPISDVFNLAASASSLRQDFATCEMIMSEKHNFWYRYYMAWIKKWVTSEKNFWLWSSNPREKTKSSSFVCSANISGIKFSTKLLRKNTSRLCISHKHLCAEV